MDKIIVLLSIITLVQGCTRAESAKKEPTEELRTCKVAAQKIGSTIDATGTVQADLEGGARILTPLPGAVQEIFVRVGDHVKKGTPLAAIRSSDAADAYSGYLASASQVKQAERTFELNKQLFEVGAITRNDLLNSEAAYEQLRSLNEGFRRKLEIYGAVSPDAGVKDTLVLKAPVDGRVADMQAHIGDRFDTSTALMTIANSNKIVIVANVFDTDIPLIRQGSEVSFTTDVFPDTRFRGMVSGISDVEDMDSKTIKVYIKPANGSRLLKQNMFLKISISNGGKTLPAVPKTALIYREGKFFVRMKNQDRFELAEVKPVRDISDALMAVDGVKENDEIVLSAIELEKP